MRPAGVTHTAPATSRPAVIRPTLARLSTFALLVAAAGAAQAQWRPTGTLAAVPVIRECDETGGDIAVSRLDPPTIYICPRVVELVRKSDPGVEHFYLVHEYGHIAMQTVRRVRGRLLGRPRAGEGDERRALPGGGDPPLPPPRRGPEPPLRHAARARRADPELRRGAGLGRASGGLGRAASASSSLSKMCGASLRRDSASPSFARRKALVV